VKSSDWDKIVRNGLENATEIDPPVVVATDAREKRILEAILSIHIIAGVRRNYGEFMEGKWGDIVRIRENEKRIYFKEKRLLWSVHRIQGPVEEKLIADFIGRKCIEHTRTGPGVRDWFRCTYSIDFSEFDEETLTKWFNPEEWEKKNGE
jgi:hypothetical protein